MSRLFKANIMIFSVFQADLKHDLNLVHHTNAMKMLQNEHLPIVELQGKYNGADELSILMRGFEHRQIVESLCRDFRQECYLESHVDRFTSLVFPDGKRKHLGLLTSVSQKEAEASNSYSYNPNAGYFMVKA